MNMETTLQTMWEEFFAARDALQKVFKMESDYTYPVCAGLYVGAGKPVDEERLDDCKHMVKSSVGIFSNFRGVVQLPLLSMLALDDDPQNRWERTQANYQILKEHFFGSEYLALVAALLCDSAKDADVPALAERGRTLYNRMKKEHPFLTGQEDSVFAVLLAESARTDDELIADMEACYRLLDERFPKGDGMQTVSHILAMLDGEPTEKVNRVLRLFDALTAAGCKYGKEREPAILAALSARPEPVETLTEEIAETDRYFHEQKGYRGVFGLDRRTRSMHAAMLVSTYHARKDADASAQSDAVMHAAAQQAAIGTIAAQQTAIATIAAQQAAMCAIIASSAAASAAASTSH